MQIKLEGLSKAKERVESLENAEVKLAECYQKLKSYLNTASFQDKRDILDMLAIKVVATSDAVNIEGVIPIEATPSKTALALTEHAHH